MNYGAPSGGFGSSLGANRLGQNTARTTYGGGGATTATTGQGYAGGPDPTLDLFKRLAMQRMAAPQQHEGPPMDGGRRPARRAGVLVPRQPGQPMGTQSSDQGLLGTQRIIGGSAYYDPNAHGDTFMGYGRGEASVPQNATISGNINTPSPAGLNSSTFSEQPAIADDESWRQRQFNSQFPTMAAENAIALERAKHGG